MRYSTLIVLFLLSCQMLPAQNIGIGTTNPAEKLDVNGNINLNGQLKINGNAGAANQVLSKDAANNLSWVDLSGYKNFAFVDCYNVGDAFPCSATNWVVPAGVTTVVLECWGGGGGGSTMSGGSSAGYAITKLTVTPGQTIVITPGYGGQKSLAGGFNGGSTYVTYPGITITAFGGDGGRGGNPATTNQTYGPTFGGGLIVTGPVQYMPVYGYSGEMTKVSFVQSNSSVFGRKIEFGNGADAPLLPGSGAKGGYQIQSTDFLQYILAGNVSTAGAGGGADSNGGTPGRGGRVIIHW